MSILSHIGLKYNNPAQFVKHFFKPIGKGNKHSVPMVKIKIMGKDGFREVKKVMKEGGRLSERSGRKMKVLPG